MTDDSKRYLATRDFERRMDDATSTLADIRDMLAIMRGVPAEMVRIARVIEDHGRRIEALERRK